MLNRFVFALVFICSLITSEVLKAEVPSLNFPDGDATGCGDIFVAKVNASNDAAVTVDGYPPRGGFGAITDQGESKDFAISNLAPIQIGLDVRGSGDAAFNYCATQPSYDGQTSGNPPTTWAGVSGQATLRLYSADGNQYADVTLTNVLFQSPDGKSSVLLPSLKLTHARVGWYSPG